MFLFINAKKTIFFQKAKFFQTNIIKKYLIQKYPLIFGLGKKFIKFAAKYAGGYDTTCQHGRGGL